jgi:hypothetical protein
MKALVYIESSVTLYTTIFLISGFQQQGDIAICLSD